LRLCNTEKERKRSVVRVYTGGQMTQNREDYIKAIFKIAEREGEASNQRIADSLEVSRASASEMVKKLIQEGFVVAEGRQLSLSAEGERIAKRILSRHRLWESFLMTKLQYEEAEVHEQAEQLEHISDEKLIERLRNLSSAAP